MIKQFLEKFGYVKLTRDLTKEPFSVEELSYMLEKSTTEVDSEFSKQEEERLFKELKNIEGFVEYLKSAAKNDKDRYFGATTPFEQLVIRGSYARTNYLATRIMNADKEKKEVKLEGVRYG